MTNVKSTTQNYSFDLDAIISTKEVEGCYRRSLNGLDFQAIGPIIGESNDLYKKYVPLSFSKKNTENGKWMPFMLKVSGGGECDTFCQSKNYRCPCGG